MSDDEEIPNFFNELNKFIKGKYTKDYGIAKGVNLSKNESVRPSLSKSELIETVKDLGERHLVQPRKVIKTLKIKDLRK